MCSAATCGEWQRPSCMCLHFLPPFSWPQILPPVSLCMQWWFAEYYTLWVTCWAHSGSLTFLWSLPALVLAASTGTAASSWHGQAWFDSLLVWICGELPSCTHSDLPLLDVVGWPCSAHTWALSHLPLLDVVGGHAPLTPELSAPWSAGVLQRASMLWVSLIHLLPSPSGSGWHSCGHRLKTATSFVLCSFTVVYGRCVIWVPVLSSWLEVVLANFSFIFTFGN